MEKINSDYKTISQVAKLLNLINNKTVKTNTHTLRLWEKQFTQITPIILSGRRRYYDNKSIELLKQIKYLLKDRGMTISGVKKILHNADVTSLDDNINIGLYKQNLETTKKIKNKIKKISKIIKELKDYK